MSQQHNTLGLCVGGSTGGVLPNLPKLVFPGTVDEVGASFSLRVGAYAPILEVQSDF